MANDCRPEGRVKAGYSVSVELPLSTGMCDPVFVEEHA